LVIPEIGSCFMPGLTWTKILLVVLPFSLADMQVPLSPAIGWEGGTHELYAWGLLSIWRTCISVFQGDRTDMEVHALAVWRLQVSLFYFLTHIQNTSTIFAFLYPLFLSSLILWYPYLDRTCFTCLPFI
jgi:hypothetical protein